MAQFLETVVSELTQESPNPNLHQLLFNTNRLLIEGKIFTDEEKKNITDFFLKNISNNNVAERFNKGVKAPQDGRIMYPLFYIPPYNPKKRITVSGLMPKTHILSANHYELEILRLLAIWKPENEKVKNMLEKTKTRLKTTCFGNFCNTGECFEASIVVLRFLAAIFPNEQEWINTLFKGISENMENSPNGIKRSSGVYFYYFLTLSDIYSPAADLQIKHYQPVLEKIFYSGATYKLEYDKLFNPIRMYISRNCLARLPEFEHIKDVKGYLGEDGRYHLYVDKQQRLPL